jgi:hypothetical protein
MTPDAAEIGRHFHADTVIHISVYKFSLRDAGMSQFYRGRLSASVVVLDLSAAARLVFGDLGPEAPEVRGDLGRVLSAIFPLPTIQPGFNYV